MLTVSEREREREMHPNIREMRENKSQEFVQILTVSRLFSNL